LFGSEYVVANAHTIMKIIFALPRNQTKRFVDGAISSFLHVLNPTIPVNRRRFKEIP
jgi:hypothetical protein